MIITRLAGGLGNQMFHYAIARHYQRNGESIVLDTRMLKPLENDIEKIVQRPYALDVFPNLQARPLDSWIGGMFTRQDFLTGVQRRLVRRAACHVKQELMEKVDLVQSRSRHIYLEGNFQSEKYFAPVAALLRKDFEFPALDSRNEAMRQQMLQIPDALSVHVRRGDFLSSSNSRAFSSVNLSYYHQAIQLMRERLRADLLSAFVFTDDPDWVRSQFKSDALSLTVIEGNHGPDSWKDMCLMSACRHHIIANSSFSWWGAWLSGRPGINLAPTHWFRPGSYPFDIHDIVPSAWQVVTYELDDVFGQPVGSA